MVLLIILTRLEAYCTVCCMLHGPMPCGTFDGDIKYEQQVEPKTKSANQYEYVPVGLTHTAPPNSSGLHADVMPCILALLYEYDLIAEMVPQFYVLL